jgi:prepilin-type processing-associated H-X9-DG protein
VPIVVTCECGKQFQTSDENAGRRARCPECGRELIVPKASAGPYEAPEPMDFAAGEERTSGKAIASLVLGLSSFFCCLFTAIPAVILGILGLNEISASQGRVKGRGMAISGLVTGVLGCSLVPIAVLLALLLPAVQAAREAARRAQCVNNLKQIGLAMHNYESANQSFPLQAITDRDGKPLLSWRVAILPYLEQEALYQKFHLDEPWDSPHNKALLAEMPMTYRCPSEPSPERTTTSYVGFAGTETMFGTERGVHFTEVTDGTANTILVVETKDKIPWTKPEDLPYDRNQPVTMPGSYHPGGFNALFADGSVRFIRNSINELTLRGLITRSGGEVVSLDSF